MTFAWQWEYPWRQSLRKRIIGGKTNFDWKIDELEGILLAVIGEYARDCFNKNQDKRNQGRIFTTLSGGIDSSLCLAMVRQTLGNKAEIHTFTVGGHSRHPDLVFAKKVAKKFKTIHHAIIPTDEMLDGARKELGKIFPKFSEKQIWDNLGVYLVYDAISRIALKDSIAPKNSFVIAHDGIDELLGGYWEHRAEDLAKKRAAFIYFWERLEPEHLEPLLYIANNKRLEVKFPYLDPRIVKYIIHIPVQDRTSHDESKIPLRQIAEKYLPKEIINRPKLGFNQAIKF
jgi:asparagine synthetase B (glutamine-hydrolysing)